jgi:oxygen-independent coproporphyrinogen-3 oxidase
MSSDARLSADLLDKYDGRVPRYTSYPTAPHFSASVDAGVYGRWLRALDPAAPLSLYLHVPFCDTLCWFCGCNMTVVNKRAPIDQYVELLLVEIDLVAAQLGADRPGGRRRVTHVHAGGGSPTILSPDQVRAVFGRLHRYFDFAPDADVAVEIDPRGLSEETIAAFAESGLTRASIGVQDLDPAVQQAVNRIQPHEVTANCVELMRRHGVKSLNIDLMYGLPYQTAEGTLDTVDRILELEPDRIALFGYAHVPWMKKHQKLLPEAALPGTEERWRQFHVAADRLVAAGYVRVGLDHFAKPHDSMAEALRAGTLRRNFQGYTVDHADALIGLGASAIGALPHGHVQNAPNVRDYKAAIEAGRLPTAKGVELSADDRLRRDAIEAVMCDMTVDLAEIADRHGVDLAEFYGAFEQLREMQADRVVRLDGCRVTVLDQARPLLRSVAAVFDRYLATGAARHAKAV